MKTISGICIAVLTVAVSAQPQCTPYETTGYQNCKRGFYVNGRGADALWCMTEADCFKVFPGYEPNIASEPWRPEPQVDPAPAERESNVDGVQEAVSAAPSVTAVSALVAASAVAAILC